MPGQYQTDRASAPGTWPARLGVEVRPDPLREPAPDAGHRRDVLDAGVAQDAARPEDAQERALPRRPDALEVVERGALRRAWRAPGGGT